MACLSTHCLRTCHCSTCPSNTSQFSMHHTSHCTTHHTSIHLASTCRSSTPSFSMQMLALHIFHGVTFTQHRHQPQHCTRWQCVLVFKPCWWKKQSQKGRRALLWRQLRLPTTDDAILTYWLVMEVNHFTLAVVLDTEAAQSGSSWSRLTMPTSNKHSKPQQTRAGKISATFLMPILENLATMYSWDISLLAMKVDWLNLPASQSGKKQSFAQNKKIVAGHTRAVTMEVKNLVSD